MANQVAARLKGDDYQHLFAWLHALELLMPQRFVSRVIVEDAKAVSADDVTLLRDDGAHPPDRYHQIKNHVDYRAGYSIDVLTEHVKNESSLLQKWYRSWVSMIVARPNRPVEIDIVSNWGWVPGDDLAGFVDGQCNGLKEEFFTATAKQKAGKLRAKLADHVGATLVRFDEFARPLRFHFGYTCWHMMAERASERMEHHGLKSDENALILVVGIVREWVKSGLQEITRDGLEAIITRYDLWLPKDARPAANIYLTTIKDQQFDVPPEYVIDWRHHFLGNPSVRCHETVDPAAWNDKMLPELRNLETRVSSETNKRLIRVRGLARLSAWFALGYVFCDVARYTIEVDQHGDLWQSDARPSADFTLTSNGPEGEILDTESDTVVVGISVSADLESDVRRHLQCRTERIRATLFIRPNRNVDRHCLRDAGDAAALADGAKALIRDFAKHYGAKRILLFYLGPLSGACFIGHRLNAVCREIQIMEWSDPNYVPSFTLT
jgi:SMODS-associated and fused to various effectors sensor domain